MWFRYNNWSHGVKFVMRIMQYHDAWVEGSPASSTRTNLDNLEEGQDVIDLSIDDDSDSLRSDFSLDMSIESAGFDWSSSNNGSHDSTDDIPTDVEHTDTESGCAARSDDERGSTCSRLSNGDQVDDEDGMAPVHRQPPSLWNMKLYIKMELCGPLTMAAWLKQREVGYVIA